MSIYTGPDNEFDMEIYNTCMIDKMVYEERMNDPLYVNNPMLNTCFTQCELDKVLIKCKTRKAVGIDNILNEILKNRNVTQLLLKLCNRYFIYDMVPQQWLQAIVFLNPKGQ